jgi:hypothetical protein
MNAFLALVFLITGTLHASPAAGDSIASPNSARTPGAINRSVTQSNIHSTICATGYTATIRPSSSYTTALKIQQLHSGYSVAGDMKTGDYEEDHLISLELGGAPSDPKNLWPEYYNSSIGARVKDKVENALHSLVCKGLLPLKTAQKLIASNWRGAYERFVGFLPKFTLVKSSPSGSGAISGGGNGSKSANGLDPRFANCKSANAAGYGPYYINTNVEYAWYRDANHDGKVC